MCDDYYHTNLVYDKKELYKHFDKIFAKEICNKLLLKIIFYDIK